MNEEKVFFKTPAGQQLCAIHSKSSKSNHIVILIHGMGSNKDSGSSRLLANLLFKKNIDSLRIDLSGSGESHGDFSKITISQWVIDVQAAISYSISTGYSNIDLYGSSAGGNVALALAKSSADIRKVALRAPASNYPAQRLEKYGRKYMDDWKENGFVIQKWDDGRESKVHYKFIMDAENYIAQDYAKSITKPILMIHGTADKSVPVHFNRELSKLLTNVKYIELEGVDHGFTQGKSRLETLQTIANWLSE